MPGIILSLRTVDRSCLKELSLSYKKLCKETLLATAKQWHAQIFPRHFGPTNRGKYHYTPRTLTYLTKIKRLHGVGEGRFRDQVLVGKSARRLKTMAKFSATGNQATVRMEAPAYFVNPFVGSWVDAKTGKVKRRQPNKPDEVTRKDVTDREELRRFSARHLTQQIIAARQNYVRSWAAEGI